MKEKKVLGGREKVKVAVVQAVPVFMDKERTMAKACDLIREAGRNGAELIVFPETFIPGYPAIYTGGWESNPSEWGPYMIALQDNSLLVNSRDTEILGEAAREANAYTVMGCNELDDRQGSRTVYNTLVFIGRDGKVMGRHRKLMPTYTERTYWGWGNASDLKVFDTDIGRIGGLICGENLMVLDYQQVYNLQVTEGDFISQYYYDRSMKVAVIGPNVANTLFNGDDPLGQSIRVGNNVVQVIGILQSKGASMVGSTDDTMLIPLSTLQVMTARATTASGEHVVSQIVVEASDQAHVTDVTNEITSLLQARHRIAFGASNDFTITSMQDLTNTITQASNSITMLLGAIAAISLLVGGIGVMNIMLVSVVERRREIGIRKALGASGRAIWGQFLVDAALLTLTGGIIGIIAGWGISSLASRLTAIPTLVSADIIILAVSVSVGIGLFFGFYPAWSASRLDPIEALRSE